MGGLLAFRTYLLHIVNSDLCQVHNPEHEANGVQNVAFPRAVQPGDGIELRVPPRNHRSVGVRFEAVNDDFFEKHFLKQVAVCALLCSGLQLG